MDDLGLKFPLYKLKHLISILNDKDSNWKKNLLLLAIAQLIAMIGISSCVPFLPLFVRQLGVTDMQEAKLWSGLVFAGPYFLSIISVPIWGTLGDKYGRKLMIVRAIFGLAISMALMGFAQNVTQLFLLRILQGLVSGYVAATLSFVSANAPSERSGFAIGILQSSQSAGNIIGPLFGGIISDLAGIRNVFFIVGLLCLISGVLIVLYVKEDFKLTDKKKAVSLRTNFNFITSNGTVMMLLLMIIIAQAGILFTNPVFPYFVEKLNAPQNFLSTITGILLGITGLFSIIFAPAWGRRSDKKDYHKTIRISAFIVGIAIILQLLAPSYHYLFPLRIVIGIFTAAILPTLFSGLSKRAPEEITGGLMGVASGANLFGALVAYLLCSITAPNLGIEWCFIISGAFLLSLSVMNIEFQKD